MQSYRLRGVKKNTSEALLNRHPIHDVVDEGVHEDAVFVDARRRARLLGLRARAVEALSEYTERRAIGFDPERVPERGENFAALLRGLVDFVRNVDAGVAPEREDVVAFSRAPFC